MKRRWVYIVWRDAYSPKGSGWINREQMEEEIDSGDAIGSITGMFVHKDNKYITVIPSVVDYMSYEEVLATDIGYYLRIPTKTIIEIKDIKFVNVKETAKRKRQKPVQSKNVQANGDN